MLRPRHRFRLHIVTALGLVGAVAGGAVRQLPDAADVDVAKRTASDWIDANADDMRAINRNIWSYAEVGLQETRSAAALVDWLRRNGFTVDTGVAGMPTAFVASYGTGGPVVGLLAEYDALPGLSQDAVPRIQPRPDVLAGHGCGHSVFGTGSTAAAIAVKQVLEAGNLPGTIRLYGTPAEETGIGKTYMARDGYFKEDDVVLTWHAMDVTTSDFAFTKAVASVKYRFEGVASHASMAPEQGRSALDAVELMTTGVNYMREHIREDARIHYVITDGGGQPNVVPPTAEVWYYIRADRHEDVENYFAWMNEIAQGAALMTRTELSAVQVDADIHDVLPNRTLAELIHENLVRVGPPRFTDAEKEFARLTQAPLDGEFDRALSEVIEPLPDEPGLVPASTDVGEIAWFVPVGALQVASYTYGAPIHSWQVVACTGMSIGEKGMFVAAKTLAGTALDLFASPELIERAEDDFQEIRGSRTFTTLLPEGQRAPASIR